MRQNWSHLLFLHWEVDPDSLVKLLPSGLTLDTYDGKAYVGLVPFTMTGVRPIWAPSIPALSNFHETNLRTYVFSSKTGSDPGVWFFSLDAANSIAVRLARLTWHLPYHFAAMQLRVNPQDGRSSNIEYSTSRDWPEPIPAECRTSYSISPGEYWAEPGTLDFFLIERYLLYTQKSGKMYRGQVHHSTYPLLPVSVATLEESYIEAAGIVRGAEPPIAHYSPGVEVDIYKLRAIKG